MAEFIINNFYYITSIVITIAILIGISMMSNIKTAKLGNMISAIATFFAVLITLLYFEIMTVNIVIYTILFSILIGSIIGIILAVKVKMIQMPELVALLNGLGGAASAIVGGATLFIAKSEFEYTTSILALIIGVITLVGSLIAAGKLAKIIDGRQFVIKSHHALTISSALLIGLGLIFTLIFNVSNYYTLFFFTLLSIIFGWLFSIRVGGADMPITISLLNSLSGVAGSIAGMAINNVLLVAIGGVVGASGLVLTQIMCRAMNRKLSDILFGSKPIKNNKPIYQVNNSNQINEKHDYKDLINQANKIIIVPGYGMALSQAQYLVKELAQKLIEKGKEVKFAIHPVAGRMPGHMNVLLAEADINYEDLFEMDQINSQFISTDLVIVIGANDVINPAANTAVDTPIYQMPILNVSEAKNIIICNYDTSPGYAGVDNPLYESNKSTLLLGDAKNSLKKLLEHLNTKDVLLSNDHLADIINVANSIIIVPGYGMALSQAQHLVKQLFDRLVNHQKDVKFAIHPVAGRMPGHMNVLLAEAEVDYEKLYEMDAINDQFKTTDLVIVIGANDVINPAANTAIDTPIYQMPILNVSEAKNIIICNYDTSPGYAGVDNPLYERKNATLLLGDAKESLNKLINVLQKEPSNVSHNLIDILKESNSIIIVPGYGMALSQAQHLVKQLFDKFEQDSKEVKFAIHPVAGRMPGHMNVLLAEAEVDYEKLYEMSAINNQFQTTDLVIVIGANDVINPAANTAIDTPIYQMPILNVSDAKNMIICNYDKSPGYAGVDNPLYESKNSTLLLGDAKESLKILIDTYSTIMCDTDE